VGGQDQEVERPFFSLKEVKQALREADRWLKEATLDPNDSETSSLEASLSNYCRCLEEVIEAIQDGRLEGSVYKRFDSIQLTIRQTRKYKKALSKLSKRAPAEVPAAIEHAQAVTEHGLIIAEQNSFRLRPLVGAGRGSGRWESRRLGGAAP
jgi:hypothetical protein